MSQSNMWSSNFTSQISFIVNLFSSSFSSIRNQESINQSLPPKEKFFRGKEFILQGSYNLIIGRDVSNEVYLWKRFLTNIISATFFVLILIKDSLTFVQRWGYFDV